MRASDTDALICDMAQYYGIHDMSQYRISYIAILACGLPAEARSIRIMTDQKFDIDTYLLGAVADGINTWIWMNTKDGRDGINRPKKKKQRDSRLQKNLRQREIEL